MPHPLTEGTKWRRRAASAKSSCHRDPGLVEDRDSPPSDRGLQEVRGPQPLLAANPSLAYWFFHSQLRSRRGRGGGEMGEWVNAKKGKKNDSPTGNLLMGFVESLPRTGDQEGGSQQLHVPSLGSCLPASPSCRPHFNMRALPVTEAANLCESLCTVSV